VGRESDVEDDVTLSYIVSKCDDDACGMCCVVSRLACLIPPDAVTALMTEDAVAAIVFDTAEDVFDAEERAPRSSLSIS
jgi:hypothetical protein